MDAPNTPIMADPRGKPSSRATLLWTVQAGLWWPIPFLAQLVWALADRSGAVMPHLVVFAVTVIIAAVHLVVTPRWRYAVHRWEIDNSAVYTRTGWFTQESRVAPISRVQTVDTERGPLERLFGLSTVTVTTASSAGAVRIAALDRQVAIAVVSKLAAVAASNPGDAT